VRAAAKKTITGVTRTSQVTLTAWPQPLNRTRTTDHAGAPFGNCHWLTTEGLKRVRWVTAANGGGDNEKKWGGWGGKRVYS